MLSVLVHFTAILTFSSSAQSPNAVLGTWLTGEANSHIKIYKAPDSNVYFGKIVWLKEPNEADGTPKKDEEGKPILNMVNLRDFIYDDDEWTDGTIYDPKSGNTYYSTMTLKDANTLKVRGSIDSFGLIGRTDVWTRVK